VNLTSEKQTAGADPANPIIMPIEPIGARGACLIIKTLPTVGIQIDLSLEGDTTEKRQQFNPKDPAHVLAWYVQQHGLSLIAHAAVALAETAKAEAAARADVQGQSEAGFARVAAANDPAQQNSEAYENPPAFRTVESGRHDIELADSEGGAP